MEPVDSLTIALTNFTCDDASLVKLVKDTLRALDRDLEEGNYEVSIIAEKTYEELEEYLDDLTSFEDDDDDEEDDDLRDVDDD